MSGAERKSSTVFSQPRSWLLSIVEHVRAASRLGFAGLGLIVYLPPLRLAAIPLAPTRHWPPLPPADIAAVARFLAQLSDVSNPLHDGFHLVDADALRITHLSHLVAPVVSAHHPAELPDHPVGARVMTALLVSRQPSVRLVLTMSADGTATLFDRGRMVRLP